MSAPLLHPVGPHPARVYWRRRALVVLGGVVLLGVGVQQCSGAGRSASSARPAESVPGAGPAATGPAPGSAAPGGPASPGPAAGLPASPAGALPVPAGAAPCEDGALEVSATVAASSYVVGSSPKLTLTVRSTGNAPCTRELGTAQRELRVTSGADRVWSSDDCDRGTAAELVTLAPGEPRSFTTSWSGRRSVPGCAGGPAAAAGAGTYRVHGRVGERTVPGGVFTLTAP